MRTSTAAAPVAGPPGHAAVLAACPAGSRRAAGQASWLAALRAHPDFGLLRADAASRLLELAWVLAARASWRTQTTMPTWATLAELTGLSRRSVARHLAWLRAAGLLGVVETGSTAAARPLALSDGRNRAAVYVLAVPTPEPVDETGTPTGVLTVGEDPVARASRSPRPQGGPGDGDASGWPLHAPTRTGAQRLAAARRLAAELPWLAGVGERRIRHVLRAHLAAGWAVRDVLYALDHAPDGTAWTYTADVTRPGGWLAWRLRQWTAGGVPLPAPLAAVDAKAARAREEDRRRRASVSRPRRPAPAGLVARLRAQLGATPTRTA